jgi:Protein of unknown function (DUF3096)
VLEVRSLGGFERVTRIAAGRLRQDCGEDSSWCVRERTEPPGDAGDNRRHDQLQLTKEVVMNITLSLAPLVSLLAGVLILIAPRMLNYIVAVYLIVVGVLGLFGDIRLR